MFQESKKLRDEQERKEEEKLNKEELQRRQLQDALNQQTYHQFKVGNTKKLYSHFRFGSRHFVNCGALKHTSLIVH